MNLLILQIFSTLLVLCSIIGVMNAESDLKRISIRKCEEYTETALSEGSIPSSEFPHMVAIGWTQKDDTITWNCGGALISDKFILIAAHCNYRGSPDTVLISDSTLKLEDSDDKFEVYEYIIHPDYNRNYYYNDIALIKIKGTVKLTPNRRPGCLWQNNNINENKAISTSWNNSDSSSLFNLNKVEMILLTNEYCTASFTQFKRISKGIVETQVCYDYADPENDKCKADSGGPVQIRRAFSNAHIYDIVGIAAFGQRCGLTVYERVSSHLDWIESIVWP